MTEYITTVRKELGYVPSDHQLVNHRGLCRNRHGHNYGVEVECTGPVSTERDASDEGMIVDFGDISAAWARIKPVWDHTYLNVVLKWADTTGVPSDIDAQAIHHRIACGYPVLDGPTTAENLAKWLLLAFRVERVPVTAVTLWETPTSSSTVKAS